MILTFNPFKQKRSRRWWAVSILAHVVLILLLGQVMFRFPIGQLLGLSKTRVQQERLTYIALPKPSSGSANTRSATPQPASPAPLQAPAATPSTTTTLPPVDTIRSRAAGGRGTGLNDSGAGVATGVTPQLPDSRIPLSADEIVTLPSKTQDIRDAISLAVGIVRDSIALAEQQRKPGDWTVKGKDGKVWGWDPQGNIRLGNFTIPGALLALLPLNVQNPTSPIDQRAQSWVRRDIQFHAQTAVTEDEFRRAVKRIRERKEKERQRQLAEGKPPITP